MSQQPRYNEDRFYRYPMNRIVAVIDDQAHVDTALRQLQEAGIDATAVNVLSGSQGARLLDSSGTKHGLLARLLRLAQQTAYEGDMLAAHQRALMAGHQVIYVPVSNRKEGAAVVEVLRANGGYFMHHFRRWGIEQLPGLTSGDGLSDL
jgi:hypothetical protein